MLARTPWTLEHAACHAETSATAQAPRSGVREPRVMIRCLRSLPLLPLMLRNLSALALAGLCSAASAPPPDGFFLQNGTDPSTVAAALKQKHRLLCPDGYYRTSEILYGCYGTLGKRTGALQPGVSRVIAKVPAGAQNYSAEVITSFNAELQVKDAAQGSFILKDGHVDPKFAPPAGNFRYQHTARNTEALSVSGGLPTDILIILSNLADQQGTAEIHYRFDGIRPCRAVPTGCSPLNATAAAADVQALGVWARHKFGDFGRAWDAILNVATGGAAGGSPQGGRLLAPAEISWLGWRAVCNYWGGASSASSWQQTFSVLDRDGSDSISGLEFGSGAYAPQLQADLAGQTAPSSGGGAGTASLLRMLLVPLLALLVLSAYCVYSRPAVLGMASRKAGELREGMADHGDPELDASESERKVLFMKPEDGEQPSKGQARSCGLDTLASCVFTRADGSRQLQPLPPRGAPQEVEAVVQRMCAAREDQAAQEACLRRLEDLALEPDLKQRILECGGVDATLEAMRQHASSAAVQEHACAVLGNQAARGEGRCSLPLLETGAVPKVVRSMTAHAPSAAVQETGCWALREFATTSEGRQEIQRSRGAEQVLHAMQDHPAAAAVLEHGCTALAYLAYDADFRRRIARGGGVGAVLRCMRSQPDDTVVQEAGCLALRNFACSSGPQQLILESKGDDEILQAMRIHSRSASLQETALDALLILRPAPDRLAEVGALELARAAVERHNDSASLHAKACKLVAHMAAGGDAARAQLAGSRAEDVVQRARLAFPDSEEVQSAAQEALSAMQ